MKGSYWWTLLLILLIIAVIARLDTLAVLVFCLLLATATSELWARHSLNRVTYRRHLGEPRVDLGQETTLTLEFTNAKLLPVPWLVVRDHFPPNVLVRETTPELGATTRRGWFVSVISLRWYERVRRTYHIRCDRRGWYRFGPADLESGDLFGFRHHFAHDPHTDTLVVYPRVVPVDLLGLPANRIMGDWTATQQPLTDPLRYATVRDYARGDSPRHIHWRASAHHNALVTKIYEPSNTLAMMVAIDVRTGPMIYASIAEHLELAISAAASLSIHALEQRHMVGLCSNAAGPESSTWFHIPPSRDPKQGMRLLTALAGMERFRRLPFDQLLHEVQPLVPHGTTLVAITAMPSEAIYEALMAYQESGRRVVLLTVGDMPPDTPASLTCYHLGGSDAWERLSAFEIG